MLNLNLTVGGGGRGSHDADGSPARRLRPEAHRRSIVIQLVT
jgi:hypothetical protein